jgi:hypothetical protein
VKRIKQLRTSGFGNTTNPDAMGTPGKSTLTQGIRQAKAAQPGGVASPAAPVGGGGALPDGVREKMEGSFGADFSDVRVHEGEEAGAVGALAYAQGSDIHFAPGQYDPQSGGGQELIGHELAHVVQQREGRVAAPQGKGDGINADPSLEAEADAAGARAAQGLPAQVSGKTSASSGIQRAPDPGKTGGKVTLGDFATANNVTTDTVATAGANVRAANQMSLAQMQAHLGNARNLGPRSTEEMLGAIMAGVLPRWVARVGAMATFQTGSFGYQSSNQVFATEPSDVIGLSAAQALVKVGWTPDQLTGQVGKEIGLCVLDTQAKVTDDAGPAGTAGAEKQPGVQEMNWDTLAVVAQDPVKNAWFHKQFEKYATATAQVTAADLPALFALAKKTPVGAVPDTDDPLMKEKYKIFRKALGSGVSASELFSGMGATVSETGKLGAREVMVTNEGSKFKLTPENHVLHSLGVLKQEDVDALMAPPAQQPAPQAQPAPQQPAPTN